MSDDHFAAPGPHTDEINRILMVAELPWVNYSRITLIFLGICYGLLGLLFALAYGGLGMSDPDMMIPMLVGGICGGLMMWGFALPMFLAASGLKKGRKWAWFVTVIIGGIMAPSACLPFGVVLLYGMLQEPVRKSFLDGGT